jgi:hypothetical protein
MHDYHEGLPGFSPNQILHDGCGECQARAETAGHGLEQLSSSNFRRAWQRAYEWNRMGGGVDDLAHAELPLLRMLWLIQVHLERQGVPLGTLPTGP